MTEAFCTVRALLRPPLCCIFRKSACLSRLSSPLPPRALQTSRIVPLVAGILECVLAAGIFLPLVGVLPVCDCILRVILQVFVDLRDLLDFARFCVICAILRDLRDLRDLR